ncbi:MAG: DsbA family protein [Polyangiales bacterium]
MSTQTMNKGTAIVGFVLSFVTGAGFMYAVDKGEKKGGEETATADKGGAQGGTWKQDAKVPVSSDDPAMGAKNAPVTVVIFSDYQCPFCSRVEPTLKQLKDSYGDKVRFVWKDLPLDFHKNALPAATAARVAFLAKGHEAFWKVHDKMFQNQQQLSDENYAKWLAEVGVDKAQFDKLKGQAETQVKANADLAKTLGIQGTPNFLIDGEPLTGAQPVDKFKTVIDAHLKKAQELKGKGTPDAELYAALVNTYFKQAPTKGNDEDEKEPPEDTSVWAVNIGHSPVKGPKDARATIVVFSDFQCPFCKRIEPTFAQIEKEYGNKVRFVWKNQPLTFHNRAPATANAAWEVYKQKGAEGFWKMHDALFASQPKLEDADIEAAAKTIPGVDVAKVMDAVKTLKWKDEIGQDVAQAEDLKVQGTPHSFVNGRVVNGAVPFEKFKKVIDEEIAKAEAKIKGGTAPDQVYEATIKGGKGGPMAPLPVPATAPAKGGKDAKVVIQVFSDFQCPFCKRAVFPSPGQDGKVDPMSAGLKAAEEKYKDQIKIVWRNFPLAFHNRARPAANFAVEAFKEKGADTFWKIHDELFGNQPKLEDADLEAVAKKFGIDWTKAKAAMDTDKYKAEIEGDMKDGGSVGVSGTPAFLIQTPTSAKLLVGAQPGPAFFQAIDAALAKK